MQKEGLGENTAELERETDCLSVFLLEANEEWLGKAQATSRKVIDNL